MFCVDGERLHRCRQARAVERNTVTVPLPDVHAENRTLLTRVQYRQYPAGNALKYVQHDRCVPAANVTVLRESTAKAVRLLGSAVRPPLSR